MYYKCPQCNEMLAKEDRRKKDPDKTPLRLIKGKLLSHTGAPRLRCTCGQLVVILKASLS